MDFASIMIVVITVGVFIVPIVYYNGLQQRQEKKFAKTFLDLATKQGLNITQHDLWNNRYAIGIDEKSGDVFYLHRHDKGDGKLLVALGNVEKCRVLNVKRPIVTHAGHGNVTDRLALAFSFHNRLMPDTELEFFNAEGGGSLSGEYLLVEKWADIVNKRLKTFKTSDT